MTPGTPTSSASPRHGVATPAGKAKIAEHGGADRQDRNVPILVAAPGLRARPNDPRFGRDNEIAPSILALLGLNPDEPAGGADRAHSRPSRPAGQTSRA